MILSGVLAWTVFAFGGVYASTLIVPAVTCVLLAIACRPAILTRASTPQLDRWLFAVLGAALVQIAPLPRAVLRAVSPAAEAVAQTRLLVVPGGSLPLSIDVRSSIGAAAIAGGAWLLFFTARQIFTRSGVRTTIRMVAAIGLVLSGVALAQDATAHGLMYWRWKPAQEGPAPFGPFVNRNHFSTWAMMAVPLCIGYLIAHAAAHEDRPSSGTWQGKIIAAIDARVWLLLASATLLIVATAASLSRSGLVGLAAALACGALLSWHRARQHEKGLRPSSSRTAALVITLAALVSVAVFVQVGAGAIAGRFGASGTAMADRLTIWHDTVPIVHDFWLTGTGMGTFLTSMAIYQRSSPGLIFNQAHNHYLQVAAEGGLLVGVPVFLALSAFTIAAWRSLQADRSGMYWIRAGAASGLFGVAIQSLLETGLTVPSNAALAAVLAAIVIHVPLRPAARNA